MGWALRLYGGSDKEYNGAVHNGENNDFYNEWVTDDRIGIFFNPVKKELSYFRNGKFLGTPFKNV